MSTLMEDRLTDALRARAEQVAPEDLRPLAVPSSPSHSWKPWVAGLAAAAAVAAVVVPLETRGGDDVHRPAPAVSTSPSPSAVPSAVPFAEVDRARGDVDGDGEPDLVRTDEEGLLRVDLAVGTRLELRQPYGTTIDGLADVGEAGLAIVLGIDSGDEQPVRVLHWVDGALEPLDTAGGAWLGIRAGQTTWVEDRVLYSGSYEGTFGPRPVRVATYTWVLEGDRLGSSKAPERCWRPSAEQPHPVSCTSPQGGATGVGAIGDLPPLLPAVETLPFDQRFRWEFAGPGDYAQLEGKLGPGEFAREGQVELVVSYHGKEYRAPVPAGSSPALLPTVLSGIDGDAPVLLVRQESGDTAFIRVFSIRDDGTLHEVEPVGEVFLGSGFVDRSGEMTEQRTWITAGGQLFTAQLLDAGSKRHQLWRWNDQMGDTIAPTDFGEVCIDWATDDYGRCS